MKYIGLDTLTGGFYPTDSEHFWLIEGGQPSADLLGNIIE